MQNIFTINDLHNAIFMLRVISNISKEKKHKRPSVVLFLYELTVSFTQTLCLTSDN